MVKYAENHTRDTYKLYKPDTKRVIITRDFKWVDWKMTDQTENLKMFRKAHKEHLVPGIEEDNIPKSEPEDNMPVHIIPDGGESVRQNKNSVESLEFMYHKKDEDTDTSSYNRVLNAPKKLDTFYNPTMKRMHAPVIEGNYKVTGSHSNHGTQR